MNNIGFSIPFAESTLIRTVAQAGQHKMNALNPTLSATSLADPAWLKSNAWYMRTMKFVGATATFGGKARGTQQITVLSTICINIQPLKTDNSGWNVIRVNVHLIVEQLNTDGSDVGSFLRILFADLTAGYHRFKKMSSKAMLINYEETCILYALQQQTVESRLRVTLGTISPPKGHKHMGFVIF